MYEVCTMEWDFQYTLKLGNPSLSIAPCKAHRTSLAYDGGKAARVTTLDGQLNPGATRARSLPGVEPRVWIPGTPGALGRPEPNSCACTSYGTYSTVHSDVLLSQSLFPVCIEA